MSKLVVIIKFNIKLLISWINNDYNKSNMCSSYPYFKYDKLKSRFLIKIGDLSSNELINVRRIIISEARHVFPKSYVRLDEIKTGYYDQCLERYLYEKLNRKFENKDTCWFKYAQNNKCIGWQNTEDPFNKKRKHEFYNKLLELYPMKNIDKSIINSLYRDGQGYVYNLSDKVSTNDDKVLSLYNNIRNSGYSNVISAMHSPIILDYSLKTEKYNVTSGRHRIAVLRYLRSQGKISNIKVRCHIFEHPYESLTYTRPYTESCKKCHWGKIYDPGKGTHQDFFIREGIAHMRGHPKKKGGTQKWNRIAPVFHKMVNNKTILDVGAHRGLYCIKALEYGSKEVTALDPNEGHISNLTEIKNQYYLQDFTVINGDFYDENNYKKLYNRKYDTVFFFGIIHTS